MNIIMIDSLNSQKRMTFFFEFDNRFQSTVMLFGGWFMQLKLSKGAVSFQGRREIVIVFYVS